MGYRETKPEGNYFLFFCVCFLRQGLTMPAWNSLFRGSDMVTPPPPWVSMSIGLLILPLFISSLCSHFYERLFGSRLPVIRTFRIFPPCLLCYVLSLRFISWVGSGISHGPFIDLCIVSSCGVLCWPIFAINRSFFDDGWLLLSVGIRIIFRMKSYTFSGDLWPHWPQQVFCLVEGP